MTANPAEQNRKHRFSFGLAALLLAVAIVAAVLGSFRVGYDRGYTAGQEQWVRETPYPVVYNVGDIPIPEGQEYIDWMTIMLDSIEPSSWSDVGGPGTFDHLGKNQLLISQTPAIHEEIRQVLQRMRNGKQ